MRNRVYIFSVLTLSFLATPMVQEVWAAESKEYKIKAAFLYNFIKFVDWPKEKDGDDKEAITIGIIGKDPFGDAFEPLKNKQVKNRDVVIKRFKSMEELEKAAEKDKDELDKQIEALRKCHVLFICSSEKKNLEKVIDSVKEHNVLTVGEMSGFLENGGVVNFLEEEKKIRFEVNAAAAKRAKLTIRSKLLRLAKRIVEQDSALGDEDGIETFWAQEFGYVNFAQYGNKA